MNPLSTELRNKLERTIVEARGVAEAGAKAALEALAVHNHEPYSHMSPEERKLRNHLRARARQLGDKQSQKGELEITHLVWECAYEHWHRMLFARFLAENDLLIEPEMGVAISLEECEELAKEDGKDLWTLASEFAQSMLPQIFRPDDPLLQVTFAVEYRIRLEKLLDLLPQNIFTASDALGWVYQFWQSKKRDEINVQAKSGKRIGADEISAVTQLFTEPYMVEFLLQNTLGAWWAGKKLREKSESFQAKWEKCKTETDCRHLLSLPNVTWDYLRFVKVNQGTETEAATFIPAAGIFDNWPNAAKDIKILDPCCGSGHFLLGALHKLIPIRMEEEGLTTSEAVDAVLRDNLYGIEIDERCCQIAAFSLALTSWTYPNSSGYRSLPDLQIACCGIGPQCRKEQWLKLVEEIAIRNSTPGKRHSLGINEPPLSAPITATLETLYETFVQAPILGSLINPIEVTSDMFHADYSVTAPLLSKILKAENTDDEIYERAVAVAGMIKAADLLAGKYTLVITNVPYLGRGKQSAVMRGFADRTHRDGRADLATIFLSRSFDWLSAEGVVALVTPQTWLFLTSYKKLRIGLLKKRKWSIVVKLGSNAFRGMNWWAATTALVCINAEAPIKNSRIFEIDTSSDKNQEAKAAMLRGELPAPLILKSQKEQLENPDARITLNESVNHAVVGTIADFGKGCSTGDAERFILWFWELAQLSEKNFLWLSAPTEQSFWEGRRRVTTAPIDAECLREQKGCWIRGQRVWKRQGIAFFLMNKLVPFVYDGEVFDNIIGVLVPHNPNHLAAMWCWVQSGEFLESIRELDQKAYVTPATLSKVPFDVDLWQARALKEGIFELPEPETEDPTLYHFHGYPEESTAPLQVSVARLLGYRWPGEIDEKLRLSKRGRILTKRCEKLSKFIDDDGIVCISPLRGEDPAGDRLLTLLDECGIKPQKARKFTGGIDLEEWLRNNFFEEHCKLFRNRPFIWHIWDGRRRDGFHALVNYHKLAEGNGKGRQLLESLTYSYLGDWITRQREGVKIGEGGAEDRLAAASELQKRLIAILEGEPPFDIFVRWKPIEEQPVGWEPDINDGVRLNIRPFLAQDIPGGRKGAGILRWKPNINWNKDRGKDVASAPWFPLFKGDRINDHHLTLEEKRAAKAEANRREGETANG